MVSVFRADMALHFSPNDMGMIVGVSGTVLKQFGLVCFRQFQDEFPDH